MMSQTSFVIDQPQAADVSHTEPDAPRQLSVESMNPLILIQQAVEKGMDPMQLKQLVDLHEYWTANRAREAFARAMTDCQAQMPVVIRDANNSHTGSGYARLETVTHAVKPIYTAHGFALSFSEADSTKPSMKRIVCKVSHRDGHSEPHWIDLPIDGTGAKGGKSSMNEVQGCISTGSYGHRVLTCRIFNITIADTDLDGNPPPAHPNPEADERAPKAPPRGQRNDAKAIVDRVTEISRIWKGKHPNVYGDVATWSADYKRWVMATCDRVFNPQKPNEWTDADMATCERALGIEVPR